MTFMRRWALFCQMAEQRPLRHWNPIPPPGHFRIGYGVRNTDIHCSTRDEDSTISTTDGTREEGQESDQSLQDERSRDRQAYPPSFLPRRVLLLRNLF